MIEIFNNSEIELTEICEDEGMGLKYESKTTIDCFDVHRCSKTWYVMKDNREWGTRIIMLDGEEIIVAERYEDVEAVRRKIKAEFIKQENAKESNNK